MSFCSAVQI